MRCLRSLPDGRNTFRAVRFPDSFAIKGIKCCDKFSNVVFERSAVSIDSVLNTMRNYVNDILFNIL